MHGLSRCGGNFGCPPCRRPSRQVAAGCVLRFQFIPAASKGNQKQDSGDEGTGDGKEVADAAVKADAGVEGNFVGDESDGYLAAVDVSRQSACQRGGLFGTIRPNKTADTGVDGAGDADAVFNSTKLANGPVLGQFGTGQDRAVIQAAVDEPAVVTDVQQKVDFLFAAGGG